MTNLFGLWEHQQTAVDAIETSWHEGIKSICYQLSTGGGKSRVIRSIVDNHAAAKKVIYIIAHRKKLVSQLSEEISKAGIRHGLITADAPYIKYRVQVASLQTIVRRLDKLIEPEIIIQDEAHHIKSKSYMTIINKWPNSKLLGVTATPARMDGKPLNDVFQKLITGPPMRFLIDNGFLSDFAYKSVGDIDLSGVHIRAGEYNNSELLSRVDKKVITGNAVEHYRKYADHQPAIASCVNIIHAEHVAEEFRAAGYKAIAIHSRLKDNIIENAINGLKDGSVEVLCQCELLGEGVDIPGATALIGLRPTNSLVIFLQHIGRVLRRSEGKKKAIILDHVGNYKRHGLPDDDREWSLTGKLKKDKTELNHKRCPECLGVAKKSARQCPECGFLWVEVAEKGRRSLPEEQEGELIDIKEMKRLRRLKNRDCIKEVKDNAESVQAAKRIAASYGYKPGYGYYIWTNFLKRA